MGDPVPRKIAIDEVVESAAAGVLRALEARSAGGKGQVLNAGELVKSGFFVDFIIRCGGYPGPVDILGRQTIGSGGQ